MIQIPWGITQILVHTQCMTRGFKTYPNRDLPFCGKSPLLNLQPILPPKQDSFWDKCGGIEEFKELPLYVS